MDNFCIELTSEGKEDFATAMKLVFETKCVGYRIDKEKGLVLMWTKSEHKDYVALPYEFNLQQTTDFAWGWLQANPLKGCGPDHDGDNGQGFYIGTGSWGHVDNWQEFVAIKPVWAMYGK